MTLELRDLRRPRTANRYSWTPPFDETVSYEHTRWWADCSYLDDSPWYVQVLEDGREVARVQFAEDGGINPAYAGAPALEAEGLDLHLIEVAEDVRRRGIGTGVVRALEARHPGRRLFAYSEHADEFWTSLGWDRYDRPDAHPDSYRPLFIQPRVYS